jgi:mRNA interferase RelE/StbE
MRYSLHIHRSAQKKLSRFPDDVYNHVKETVFALAVNPRPEGCLKLSGREGWRLRVRDYRIIYEIDDKHASVTILDIDHRGMSTAKTEEEFCQVSPT